MSDFLCSITIFLLEVLCSVSEASIYIVIEKRAKAITDKIKKNKDFFQSSLATILLRRLTIADNAKRTAPIKEINHMNANASSTDMKYPQLFSKLSYVMHTSIIIIYTQISE